MQGMHGPRAGVKRAKEQLATLQVATQRFFEANAYTASKAEFDKKAGHHNLRVKGGPTAFPDEWSLLVGEVAHNLRSALDGLVYQLALLHLPKGQAPTRDTQFPIFLVGKTVRKRSNGQLFWHFENTRGAKGIKLGDGRKMIRQLKRKHQAMIQGFQPYKRGNLGRRSPLILLQELNNSDKHRLLTVLASTIRYYRTFGADG